MFELLSSNSRGGQQDDGQLLTQQQQQHQYQAGGRGPSSSTGGRWQTPMSRGRRQMSTSNVARPSVPLVVVASRQRHSGGAMSHLTFANLVFCCVVASILAQSIEANDFDLENQEGKPCICNSSFYRACPPAYYCLENNIPELNPSTPPPDPRDNWVKQHDDFDPDHVANPWQNSYQNQWQNPWGTAEKIPGQILQPLNSGSYAFGRNYHDASGRIVRHRKVYLKQIDHKDPNFIHPINIRIPVKVPVVEEPVMPAPKPLFKLKKYITYERAPETIQVPVTKTIIRPIGVTPDQIIGEQPT